MALHGTVIVAMLLPLLRIVACKYSSNDELYNRMVKENRDYPNISYLYSIGTSLQGKSLWVLAISGRDPDKHLTLRPEAKYVGNIHGNEPLSREILCELIQYLLENYGKDPIVTKLLQSTRIHILPTMNPDGYELSSEGRCEGVTGRFNSAKIDLNRDFPDVYDSHHIDISDMQPESLAIVNWLKTEQFVLSASFHGGSMVVNYPYDSTPLPNSTDAFQPKSSLSLSQDDETFQHLAKKYSFAHKNMRLASCPRFKDGITNGAAWYMARGTMQDYNYVFGGCMEVTVEMSCCKYPSSSTIGLYWNDSVNALTTYLKQANIGVKGIILYNDGTPASGLRVQVNSTMSVKTTSRGEYWKLLLPGEYILKVQKDDLVVSSIPISVRGESVAIYNITLGYNESNINTNDLYHTNKSGTNKLPFVTSFTFHCVFMLIYIYIR